MANYKSYKQFANVLVDDVLSKLDGSHDKFKRFETAHKPSKIIILGSLGDRDSNFSAGNVIETKRTLTSIKNNSLSVKFLVKDLNGSIKIKPSASVYFEVYPTFNEQKKYVSKKYDKIPQKVEVARIWERKNVHIDNFEIDLSKISEGKGKYFDIDINEFDKINKDNIKTKSLKISSEYLKNEEDFKEKINETSGKIPIFNWRAVLRIDSEIFKQNNQNLNLITITFLNNTEKNNAYETFLFNCNLEIIFDGIQLTTFQYKYEYEDNTYPHENYLRCLNCHGEYYNNKIITKNYCDFHQEKLIPKSSDKFNFDDLSSRENNISILTDLYDEMSHYLLNYKEDSRFKVDINYTRKVNKFEQTIKRFLEGLEILQTNENALKAFELVNKSLSSANPYNSWRLFQLAFLIIIIPDIVDPSKRRDTCEILHVSTGGGKSEAYFGCVLFSAFWDRLSGKEFGVTAITKFPLRMLSIQQLQRVSSLFIYAEIIRKKEKIDGSPFSVGYFVGSSDKEFPRYSNDLIKDIKNFDRIPGKIINDCPVCKERENNVILAVRDSDSHIIHKCEDCGEEFNIFFTDEEIYRSLPTFIVSTVDKLAGISTNRRFRNIFGGEIDICPNGHGFIPHNDICEFENCGKKGVLIHRDFNTGPCLIIQDEMHLIREGFGTIDSHFESLMESLQVEIGGNKFKNIAMTATITGAKNQIDNLYNKKANIFPGESPKGKGNDDLFFEYDLENEEIIYQRNIIGLKPNFRDNQYASLLTLKYVTEFIESVEKDFNQFSTKNGINKLEIEEIVNNYKNLLTYHNKKSDVHSMNYYLKSVVNSKLEKYQISSRILTGENTIDDIKETIKLVDDFLEHEENKYKLLSIFATSIVSHGVDIDKWNLMIFQGIPRSTAEYIQALSRVGRKNLGLVFVWFYPNRARDLSFYQNFYDYHSFIDHKVESVPLSRWTKLGFKQTFTSIFCASIINYFSEIKKTPIYSVEQVNEIFNSNRKENTRKLIEFIQKAYKTDSKKVGADYFKQKIITETEERLNYLSTYRGKDMHFFPNALKNNDRKYYKTQYGMRGIQDEVLIQASYNDSNFLKLSKRNKNG